jgi:hypothetical protein
MPAAWARDHVGQNIAAARRKQRAGDAAAHGAAQRIEDGTADMLAHRTGIRRRRHKGARNLAAPIYIGTAYGQDCRRLRHAGEETFAVAGRRLGCPAKPGNRQRDSEDGSTILRRKRDTSGGNSAKQKKNKSGYFLFFNGLYPLVK